MAIETDDFNIKICVFHVYQRVMIDYTGWIKWCDSEMMGEHVD